MERKKIGLALSGGAARGFAHLGVLKALDDHGISIDYVAGTSAGSFVGGALASGMSVDEMLRIGREIGWFNMTGLSYSPKGLLSNAPMGNFIKKNFPVREISEMKIPYAAVACDLTTGEEVILKDSGDLAFAIRASCAVPGVFMPLEDDKGRILVDGGVVAPIPTETVKNMGADLVIAVDLLASGSTFRGAPKTMVGMLFQSALMLLRAASINQHYRADVVIIPPIAHLRPDEINKRDEFIELGEKAALEKIDEIISLLQPDRAESPPGC